MTDLSPQLRNLVTTAKAASRPSVLAQTRVLQALEARLGPSAFAGNVPPPTTGAALVPSAIVKVAAISAAGIALLGGAAWLRWGSFHESTARPVQISSSAEPQSALDANEPIASSTVEALPMAPAQSAANTASSNGAGSGKARSRDRLAEEVGFISRAQGELAAARPANAMRLLDEHERKFPTGILTEERIAARVQALCALGRTAEASAQLSRLSPRSLHRGQAQSACGAKAEALSARKGSPATSN